MLNRFARSQWCAACTLLGATILLAGCVTEEPVGPETLSRELDPKSYRLDPAGQGTLVVAQSVTSKDANPVEAIQASASTGALCAKTADEIVTRKQSYEITDNRHRNAGIISASFLGVAAIGGLVALATDQGSSANVGGGVVLIFGGLVGLASGITYLVSDTRPPTHEDRTIDVIRHRIVVAPSDPWMPCSGGQLKPAIGVPLVGRVAFGDASSGARSLELRTTTDSRGLAGWSLPISLAAAYCGTARFDVGVGTDWAVQNREQPQGRGHAELKVGPGPKYPIGELSKLSDRIGALALSCCRDAVTTKSADGCEEQCDVAGQVQNCLYSRRACMLRARRLADPKSSAGECGHLYEECLVGRGTSVQNIHKCVEACADIDARSECR